MPRDLAYQALAFFGEPRTAAGVHYQCRVVVIQRQRVENHILDRAVLRVNDVGSLIVARREVAYVPAVGIHRDATFEKINSLYAEIHDPLRHGNFFDDLFAREQIRDLLVRFGGGQQRLELAGFVSDFDDVVGGSG